MFKFLDYKSKKTLSNFRPVLEAINNNNNNNNNNNTVF